MRLRVVLAIVLMFAVVLPAVGCAQSIDDNVLMNQARDDWQEKTGEAIANATPYKYTDRMSESHRMMISTILSGRGMSTDLDQYSDLYLVKMTTAAGEERMVVIEAGTTIFPASVEGEQ